MEVTVKFTEDGSGYLVSPDGYRLCYGGVGPEWRVKPEDYPIEPAPENVQQQPMAETPG